MTWFWLLLFVCFRFLRRYEHLYCPSVTGSAPTSVVAGLNLCLISKFYVCIDKHQMNMQLHPCVFPVPRQAQHPPSQGILPVSCVQSTLGNLHQSAWGLQSLLYATRGVPACALHLPTRPEWRLLREGVFGKTGRVPVGLGYNSSTQWLAWVAQLLKHLYFVCVENWMTLLSREWKR